MPYVFRLNSEPEGVVLNLDVEETWSPVVSYDGSDVVETIPINLTAATDDAQAANLQALHRIQENVRYYVNEPSSQYTQETWLEWQMLDESSTRAPRRRLVKAMDVAFDQGMWFTCGEGNIAREMRVILTLRCTGWWESSVAVTNTSLGITSPLMAYNFFGAAGEFHGDAPGRLEFAYLTGNAVVPPGPDIYGAYMAFRSDTRHGTLNNFVPLWELEDGTTADAGGTAAAIVAGASPTAIANNCMLTDFTTGAAMDERCYIEFSDVTANYTDNYGRFLVFYRGVVDAGTTECTVRVDIRQATEGAVTPTISIQGTAFTVDSTSWICYDTGLIVQLPPTGTHTTMALPENYGFSVHASRESVAGSLYSDCLILIPIDEYMIFGKWDPGSGLFVVTIPGGDDVGLYFDIAPDESAALHLHTEPSDVVLGVDLPYITGDGIPTGNDVRVYFLIFTTSYGSNILGERTRTSLSAYPRYHSLQGAD